MDDLSDEVLKTIFGYCDLQDIKNLRLACKTTLRIANEHLFPEIVLFMHRESLKACAGTAVHPVFSKTAKSLLIQAARPREVTFQQWERGRINSIHAAVNTMRVAFKEIYESGRYEHLSEEQKDQAKGALEKELQLKAEREAPALSDEQIEIHFAHAVRLIAETHWIFEDGSLYTCLRDILEHCTNLDTIDLTIGDFSRAESTYQSKDFKLGMLRPYHSDLDGHNPGEGVAVKLVLAAAEANFKPRVVRLGNISHRVFMRASIARKFQRFLDKVQVLEWEFAEPPFNALTYDIKPEYVAMIQDFNQPDNKFVPLMSAAKNLTLLRLELPDYWGWSDVQPVRLESVVSSIDWQHLTNVSIWSFEVTPTVLKDFLLRHKLTLTRVHLGQVRLRDGTWPDCFASFAGKLPKIQEFELRGEYQEAANVLNTHWYDFGLSEISGNNNYGTHIFSYVIAGGEVFPPRPAIHEDNVADLWVVDPDDGGDEVMRSTVRAMAAKILMMGNEYADDGDESGDKKKDGEDEESDSDDSGQ